MFRPIVWFALATQEFLNSDEFKWFQKVWSDQAGIWKCGCLWCAALCQTVGCSSFMFSGIAVGGFGLGPLKFVAIHHLRLQCKFLMCRA